MIRTTIVTDWEPVVEMHCRPCGRVHWVRASSQPACPVCGQLLTRGAQ